MPTTKHPPKTIPIPFLVFALLTLSTILTGCGTITERLEPVEVIPPECTKEYAQNFPVSLSELPASFLDLSPREQARELVILKSEDAEQYSRVLNTLIRCAHE